MIKCEWIYCKYNQVTGICSCSKDIILRCATSQDLRILLNSRDFSRDINASKNLLKLAM